MDHNCNSLQIHTNNATLFAHPNQSSFVSISSPDIAALRDRGALPTAIQLAPTTFQPPALEDLEAPRRQTSMDGEAIKIVIHDVDSGPICASKRRVVLRRDPTDKAHRSK